MHILFVSVCYDCGKDSSSSYLSKAYHVPDPLSSGSGNVLVTRRPGSCQERSLQPLVLTGQLTQDHAPLLFGRIKKKKKSVSTQTWTLSVLRNCDELYSASQWEPAGNYHNEVITENSL